MLVKRSRRVPKTMREAIAAVEEARFPPLLERELWAEACVRNLWSYLLYAFGTLAYTQRNPGQNWLELGDESMHHLAADWSQEHVEDWERTRATRTLTKDLLYLWPRGTAKSITVTCGLHSWCHLRDVNLSTYLDSYKLKVSQDFHRVIQNVWSGSATDAWWQVLYGSWEPPRGDRTHKWNENESIHALRTDMARKDPSFECVSVETGLTSHHPDTAALDDLVVEEKLREEGHAWIDAVDKHMGQVPYALLMNGLKTLCMTRYTDDDPGVVAMRLDGVRSFAPTGQRPHEDDYRLDEKRGRWDVFFAAGMDADGKVYFPRTWPRERIESEIARRPQFAASQVLLHPMSGKHHPVQPTHVARLWVRQESVDLRALRLSIHWDTAFSPERKARGDRSVIVLAGQPTNGSGEVWYLRVLASQTWDDVQFLDEFAKLLQELDQAGVWPFAYTDEASSGKRGAMGNYARTYLGSKYGIMPPRFIEIQRSSGPSKEARVSYAAGFWQSGHVRLVEGAEGMELLVAEMLAFPDQYRGHDDVRDAAADALRAPEIYKPTRLKMDGEAPQPHTRPYDKLLRLSPRDWTSAEADLVYAEDEKRERRERRPRARHVRRLEESVPWRP